MSDSAPAHRSQRRVLKYGTHYGYEDSEGMRELDGDFEMVSLALRLGVLLLLERGGLRVCIDKSTGHTAR